MKTFQRMSVNHFTDFRGVDKSKISAEECSPLFSSFSVDKIFHDLKI